MAHPIIEDLKRRYYTKIYDATKRIPDGDMEMIKKALFKAPKTVSNPNYTLLTMEYIQFSIV